MRRGMTTWMMYLTLLAVIPLSAQTQDQTQAPPPKPKVKHVYTDEDIRPLADKCADPSVPAEDKASCPKAPVTDKSAGANAPAKEEAPKYDANGDLIPVPRDIKTLGTDDLNQMLTDTQVQQDRAQESIDRWTKRLAAATDDKDKKMYQQLLDDATKDKQKAIEQHKAAQARLDVLNKQQ